MQQLLIKTTAASLIVALTLGAAGPLVVSVSAAEANSPKTDNSAHVNANEVRQALTYTGGVLAGSDTTVTSSDQDSALVAATAEAAIDVPKDASDGITFTTSNGAVELDIQLPNADQAAAAKQIAPGIVAYASNNGSANAVQADEGGGVRMLTVIDNPKAPTAYPYKVSVPNSGRIEILPDGGAIVVDGNGYPLSFVSAPWAKDARGKEIRTWFTTDGTTLTQHVKHNVRGVVYPVTADPAWFAIAGGVIAWAMGACATSVIGSIGLDGVRWAIQRGDWYWNKKLEDALWNCAWGAASGGVLRFAPGSVKSWCATQIRNGARTILGWRV